MKKRSNSHIWQNFLYTTMNVQSSKKQTPNTGVKNVLLPDNWGDFLQVSLPLQKIGCSINHHPTEGHRSISDCL